MAGLPRMRSARGVLEELKRIDPDTPITIHFVRGLFKSGEVPVVCAGNRQFVNLDTVLDFLANQSTVNPVRYSHRTGTGAGATARERGAGAY